MGRAIRMAIRKMTVMNIHFGIRVIFFKKISPAFVYTGEQMKCQGGGRTIRVGGRTGLSIKNDEAKSQLLRSFAPLELFAERFMRCNFGDKNSVRVFQIW